MSTPSAVPRLLGRPWVLTLLALGTVFWGWWLAALSIPWSLGLTLGLVVVYLLGVGTGGIVLASIYFSGWVAVAIAINYFPSFWPTNAHYKYWAFTLITLWALGLGHIFLVAKQGSNLRQRPSRERQWGILITLGILFLALQGGRWVYQTGWPLASLGLN